MFELLLVEMGATLIILLLLLLLRVIYTFLVVRVKNLLAMWETQVP